MSEGIWCGEGLGDTVGSFGGMKGSGGERRKTAEFIAPGSVRSEKMDLGGNLDGKREMD